MRAAGALGDVDFSRNKSFEYLLFAFAASCNPRGIVTWTCPYCGPRIHLHGFVGDTVNQTFGYIGYRPENETVLVVFRGSQTVENYIIDFEFAKVPYNRTGAPGLHMLATWRVSHPVQRTPRSTTASTQPGCSCAMRWWRVSRTCWRSRVPSAQPLLGWDTRWAVRWPHSRSWIWLLLFRTAKVMQCVPPRDTMLTLHSVMGRTFGCPRFVSYASSALTCDVMEYAGWATRRLPTTIWAWCRTHSAWSTGMV